MCKNDIWGPDFYTEGVFASLNYFPRLHSFNQLFILLLLFWPCPWHMEVPVPPQWPEPQQWEHHIPNPLSHQGTPQTCFKREASYCSLLRQWLVRTPARRELFIYFFSAALMAFGSTQGRGGIRATAAGLCHSDSNTRSKLHLWPIPQLMATLDP